MQFQGVVVNVADLKRSIDFYREVFGFTVLSQDEQLAAVSVSGGARAQAMILRAFGTSPLDGGGHIGLRAFLLEADSDGQLEQIASELDSRKHLFGRRDHKEWSAVVGHDPDGVTVVLVRHRDVEHTEDGWRVLDDFLYGLGE